MKGIGCNPIPKHKDLRTCGCGGYYQVALPQVARPSFELTALNVVSICFPVALLGARTSSLHWLVCSVRRVVPSTHFILPSQPQLHSPSNLGCVPRPRKL